MNGLQTLAENIADNGGIREAFQAYQAYVDRYGEEPRLPGLEEFSPEHIFYLGFANVSMLQISLMSAYINICITLTIWFIYILFQVFIKNMEGPQ